MAACRVLTEEEPGNRTSDTAASGTWTYDNLNRMTASPHGSYTNDLLGNRTLWDVSGDDDPVYYWDLLNRLVKFQSSVTWPKTSYVEYQYRADGMRVKKFNNWVDPDETTKYFYDGQMGIEDVWDDGTDDLVTRYGIGARGIEVISKIENGGSETFGFPLYDTHGNMLATLGRSGSSFTTGNWQSYDVWGSVRSGSSSEQQGYVANLGHRSDPESFLTYMRARYYEPMTGRFVSEDKANDGSNWFVYARNMPTCAIDLTGKSASVIWAAIADGLWAFMELVGNLVGIDLPKVPHMFIRTVVTYFAIAKNWALGDQMITAGRAVATMAQTKGGWFGVGMMAVGVGAMVGGALLKVQALMMFANLMFELYTIAIDEEQQAWWF
jgi:RHS repeat-associated protein